MLKYAKVISEETKLCEVGIGTNTAFYQSLGMTEQDVEQSDKDGAWYLKGFAPMKTPEEKAKELAQAEIEALERQQTARLYREALAGGEYAINKLAEIDALIAEQRAIINPPVAEETEVEQNA